jgi:hypothetical protein
LAHCGNNVFYGGNIPSAFISQTVDLTSVAGITLAEIDAGALAANFSFWFSDTVPNSGSQGRFTLSFFSGTGMLLGQGNSGFLSGGELTWYNGVGSMPIPSGSRFIVYTMDFLGTSSVNSGLMDDNVLTISLYPLTANLLVNPGGEGNVLTGWYVKPGEHPPADTIAAPISEIPTAGIRCTRASG